MVGIEGGVVSGVINLESSGVGASDWRPRHEELYQEVDSSQPAAETAVYLFDDWFDPIEAGVRDRVREFIQAMVEGELDSALMRPRYGRRSQSSSGDADGPVDVTGIPARPSFTFADGDLWADRNRDSAGPARQPGRQDDGVEGGAVRHSCQFDAPVFRSDSTLRGRHLNTRLAQVQEPGRACGEARG